MALVLEVPFHYSIKKLQSNLPQIRSEKHHGNGIPLRGILGSKAPLLSCPPRLGPGNAFAWHPHKHGIRFLASTDTLLTTPPSPAGTHSTIYVPLSIAAETLAETPA